MAKDKSKGDGSKKGSADKSKHDKSKEKPSEKVAGTETSDKADAADKKVAAKAEKADAEHKAPKAAAKKVDEGKAARAKEPAHDHDNPDHAKPHAHAGHGVNRREYWVIFVVLFVLTVLEVGVAQIPGISKTLMAIALISLALVKAACVGLFYMHLKHETKIMKLSVAIPFAAPALYAVVLIADGAWRMARW